MRAFPIPVLDLPRVPDVPDVPETAQAASMVEVF
jgi:hypothetical protein